MATALLSTMLLPAAHADGWHGSVRSKVQVDNRYTWPAYAFGELWAQAYYDAADSDLHGVVDAVARTTQIDGGNYAKLYQGFVEKGFAAIDGRVRLGRFQRTDNLGFYLVDGGNFTYQAKAAPWAVETYAGRPSRIDHLRSVDGDFVGGFEARGHWQPGLGDAGAWPTLDSLDLRGGYQYFRNSTDPDAAPYYGFVPGNSGVLDPETFLAAAGYASPTAAQVPPKTAGENRLGFAGTVHGMIRKDSKHAYELGLLGTYRTEVNHFENVLAEGRVDVADWLRFRSSWEYYRPREPYLSFREKFYSAWAVGQQTLYQGRFDLMPAAGTTIYAGGLYATRQGDAGSGATFGGSYQVAPPLTVLAEFDYLGLGGENAKSGYGSLIYTANSRLQLRWNGALRYDQRFLYGDNRALGAEAQINYMLRSDILLEFAGSYIWNTRLKDEYLGAVQVVYYFEPFKPKAM